MSDNSGARANPSIDATGSPRIGAPESFLSLDGLGVLGQWASVNIRKSCVAHGHRAEASWVAQVAIDAELYCRSVIAVSTAPWLFDESVEMKIHHLRLKTRERLRTIDWILEVEPLPEPRADGADSDIARLCNLPERQVT